MPRRDALKVLPAALTADQEYRQRFSREADIASELWHPHIVGVHDRGEFEGQLWLSRDYIDDRASANGLLAVDTTKHIFAFRVPAAMANGADGTHVNAELFRKERIAPAVRHNEWARAAVAAANGLETAG